jgi:hypothetical protein
MHGTAVRKMKANLHYLRAKGKHNFKNLRTYPYLVNINTSCNMYTKSDAIRDSVFCTVIRLRAVYLMNRGSICCRRKSSILFPSAQICSGTQPTTYSLGNMELLTGGKPAGAWRSLLSVLRSRMNGAAPLFPPCAFMVFTGTTFHISYITITSDDEIGLVRISTLVGS